MSLSNQVTEEFAHRWASVIVVAERKQAGLMPDLPCNRLRAVSNLGLLEGQSLSASRGHHILD